MVMRDFQRIVLVTALGGFFFATSRDAPVRQSAHDHARSAKAPVCSDKPAQDSVQRMNAIQSLRETQVEVEMMKRHQSAATE